MGIRKIWIFNLLIFLIVIALTGCSGLTTVSPEMMQAAGVDIDNGVSTIADASVLKELAVHKTLQNRDTQIAKATKNAGFKSEWKACKETVFYPGMQAPLLVTKPCLEVSFTPMPEFKQQLPTAPSVHPGYAMTEHIVTKIANATLIGYGLHTLGNVLETGFSHAGDDYSNSTYKQSFNPGDENVNVGEYTPSVEPIEKDAK